MRPLMDLSASVGEGSGRPLTVASLAARYLEFARGYYVKHGRQTTEVEHIVSAVGAVVSAYGDDPVSGFGPLKLKAVRLRWVERGFVRVQVNKRVGRVRRMFAWGVEEELVPATVLVALGAVRGLAAGRTPARESDPVGPVSDGDVDAVRAYVPRPVWSMIELQRCSGMRPGEVVLMRGVDVDRSARVWEYRPGEHKTEHHRRCRVVYLGPRAREVLTPWLLCDASAYLFSPRAWMAERALALRSARKTRVQPSQLDRRKPHPVRIPAERYTRASYGRAIARACRKAGVSHWSPNQLRHSLGTRVRREMGLEASQVVLGHARADVTQIYAERDARLARDAMERLG